MPCRVSAGSDDAPQSSATLFVEVDALSDQPLSGAAALRLRGPGIENARDLAVAGLPAAFWQWRVALQAEMPRGVDLVLDMVGGDYVRRNIEALAPGGRHVSIASLRGAEATIPIFRIMQKRLILTGSTLRATRIRTDTASTRPVRSGSTVTG